MSIFFSVHLESILYLEGKKTAENGRLLKSMINLHLCFLLLTIFKFSINVGQS